MVTDLVGDGFTTFGRRFTSEVFPRDDPTTATVASVGKVAEPIVELSLRTANHGSIEAFCGDAAARIAP